MSAQSLLAFFSYAHFDDENDDGALSQLRERLEREIQAQTGKQSPIFHDRRDIELGHAWEARIDEALDSAAFLIPVVTPSYLVSAQCRRELEHFSARERALGHVDLILPIYYIRTEELEGADARHADAVVTLLRSRQRTDWREMRHEPLTSPEGRKSLTALAGNIKRAIARVGAAQVLSAPAVAASSPVAAGPPTSTAPVSSSPAAARVPPLHAAIANDDALLVAQVVDDDPLVSHGAARALWARPELLTSIANCRAGSPVGEAAVRSVMRRHPAGAADVLMAQLRKADSEWGAASRVTGYFDPSCAGFCEAELVENILHVRSIDLSRLSIEALGHCGAVSWAHTLRKLVADDGYLDKLGSYLIEAIARLFVRSADAGSHVVGLVGGAFAGAFDDLIRLDRPSISWFRLLGILMECDGRHADVILGSWTRSPTKELSTLGVEMLGHLGIVRAAGPLVTLLDSTEDAALTRECSAALARIGSPDAIARLLAAPLDSDEASGLVFGVAGIQDETSFARVTDHLLTEDGPLSYFAIRAVGRRQAVKFAPSVLEAFEAPEALKRGCAALALSRLGRADPARLRVANNQAADEKERLFTALALIAIDASLYDEMEASLRSDLAKDSFALWPHLQADILDVLRGTGRPDAAALAEAWEPFYRHVRP